MSAEDRQLLSSQIPKCGKRQLTRNPRRKWSN